MRSGDATGARRYGAIALTAPYPFIFRAIHETSLAILFLDDESSRQSALHHSQRPIHTRTRGHSPRRAQAARNLLLAVHRWIPASSLLRVYVRPKLSKCSATLFRDSQFGRLDVTVVSVRMRVMAAPLASGNGLEW